jgi:Peptidase MA superfamily
MIKKAVISTIIALVFIMFLLPGPGQVEAQAPASITVNNSTAQMDFPLVLNFSCQIKAASEISDIRLQYQVEHMSYARVTAETQVVFTPATTVNAKYSLNMLRVGQFPPGLGVDYWWVVKDAAGNKFQSNPTHYIVADNHHTWQNLAQDKIDLLWYGQNNSFGQSIMSTTQKGLETLAERTGASPDRTIHLSIYTSEQDYHNSTIGESEWSGGETLPEYNSIILLIRPGSMTSDLSGISHELAHVIVDQVTYNPYNFVPYWLNEGIAMDIQYADGGLISQFSGPLRNAINNNTLISVRSLCSPFSAFPEKAYLSYAESYSIVDYLISQFGAAKMLQFLNSFKQGITYDGALQSVYGFDMDGLNNQWKTWVTPQYKR